MAEPRVVVVGAGIGGLVSALLLAARGLDVTVVEQADEPGGKMRRVWVGGQPIDAGPTVFTMRWILDQIFEQAGLRLDDQVALQPLSILARHAWAAGGRLDLFANTAASADAIGALSGADEARRFLAFCGEARTLYRTLEGPYIRAPRPTVPGIIGELGVHGLAMLLRLGPMATLWQRLGHHFTDPRLRQLFGRYATYCGGSPWRAPATLMLVAQVEMDGVWAVGGGMHALARALAASAVARGARLRMGCAVERIDQAGGRACGVTLAGGERLAADAVVFNGDAQALADGLLGAGAVRAVRRHEQVRRGSRSLSAVTWLVNAPTQGFDLVRHNLFFDDDYASEFDDVFRRRRLPERGTVYVCAQDRDDSAAMATDAAGAGPRGGAPAAERLLCLVNAPPDGDRGTPDDAEIDACESRAFQLMQRCGLTLGGSPSQRVRVGPRDFHRLFPATGGALYGRASHGWMTPFVRPASASRLPGLYLAGGSVHPGPGVPMAAMSGQLAAAALMAHLASTSRWRPAATCGGTSTPSATTAATG